MDTKLGKKKEYSASKLLPTIKQAQLTVETSKKTSTELNLKPLQSTGQGSKPRPSIKQALISPNKRTTLLNRPAVRPKVLKNSAASIQSGIASSPSAKLAQKCNINRSSSAVNKATCLTRQSQKTSTATKIHAASLTKKIECVHTKEKKSNMKISAIPTAGATDRVVFPPPHLSPTMQEREAMLCDVSPDDTQDAGFSKPECEDMFDAEHQFATDTTSTCSSVVEKPVVRCREISSKVQPEVYEKENRNSSSLTCSNLEVSFNVPASSLHENVTNISSDVNHGNNDNCLYQHTDVDAMSLSSELKGDNNPMGAKELSDNVNLEEVRKLEERDMNGVRMKVKMEEGRGKEINKVIENVDTERTEMAIANGVKDEEMEEDMIGSVVKEKEIIVEGQLVYSAQCCLLA